jgi:hypothetical protein
MVLYSYLQARLFKARSSSSGVSALILGKYEELVNSGKAAMRLFNRDVVGLLIVVHDQARAGDRCRIEAPTG